MASDPCDATISGVVWIDMNGDGQQQNDETVLAGTMLRLTDASGALTATETSDAQGYLFAELCIGDYRIEIVLASNEVLTGKNIGAASTDSDAEPSSGITDTISIAESADVSDVGFGVIDALTLDDDGDGVPNVDDAFPNDATETQDSDGDGVGDNADLFPNDPDEQTDSDQDGVGDNADPSPLPLAQGVYPTEFSALYTAGDSVTRDRPLFGWGDHYARKLAGLLGVSLNNAARSAWVMEQIHNGDGSFNQLDFLYGTPRVADPNGLHIVYGGYNDVFFRDDPFRFDVVNESAEEMRAILLKIANAGGRYAVIPLVYDVGRQISSDADGIRPMLRSRSIDFNNALIAVVADINMGTDMTVMTYDVFAEVEEIYANPAASGFTNLDTACMDTQANCAGFFWWDEAHPADDVHTIISNGIAALLDSNS